MKPGTLAFNGFSGQMMLNQLVKKSSDSAELAALLIDVLRVPADEADALGKTRRLEDYVETIRVGAHPAPGHIPFLLSYFWGLADHQRWPVLWASTAAYLEFATGLPLPTTPSERVAEHLRLVKELDIDPVLFAQVAAWWHATRPVILDPVLTDRAQAGLDENAVDPMLLEQNARALLSVARYIGNELVDSVAQASGRTLRRADPQRRVETGSASVGSVGRLAGAGHEHGGAAALGQPAGRCPRCPGRRRMGRLDRRGRAHRRCPSVGGLRTPLGR